MRRRLRPASPTPPKLQIKLFNALVKQILTYGSDVWGACESANKTIDTFHRAFLKYTLSVKGSTPNAAVYGELGVYPLHLELLASCFKYFHRLQAMNNQTLVKKVFNELSRLDNLSFPTWVSKVREKAAEFDLDLYVDFNATNFKRLVTRQLKIFYLISWHIELIEKSKLNCYNTLKTVFRPELYLSCIRVVKHRIAFSRLRCSSHHLAVETGRWRSNPLPINRRICSSCRVLDDEIHFVVDCRINRADRARLCTTLLHHLGDDFATFRVDLFINLMCSEDVEVLKAAGKFLYTSFENRTKIAK